MSYWSVAVFINQQQALFVELLSQAGEFESVNISFIQRKLLIGYNRARRFHRHMLNKGWIKTTERGYLPIAGRRILSKMLAKHLSLLDERLGNGC